MSDGHRSGRSTGRVSCKSTDLKRCSMIEMRWNNYSNRIVIFYYYYYDYYAAFNASCVGHNDDESQALVQNNSN